MAVQNKKSLIEIGVQNVIDDVIVDTVHQIFSAVLEIDQIGDLFDDLTKRLATELLEKSFMDMNLELTEDQRLALANVVRSRGYDVVRVYQANLEKGKRTKEIYKIVQDNTALIADSVLRSIGQNINRGCIINAVAVASNAKSDDYNEITLRSGKAGGDITIPTQCVLISTNCVSVIQRSCMEKFKEDDEGEFPEGAAADAIDPNDE